MKLLYIGAAESGISRDEASCHQQEKSGAEGFSLPKYAF
jgi:hypothetical protein